jgi:hypothetical protein
MKKKITSIMLVFAMIVTVFQFGAVSAFAADYDNQIYVYNKMMVDTLPNDSDNMDIYLNVFDYITSLSKHEPELVSLVNEITAGITKDYDKVKALHDWVATNIWYDYDVYNAIMNKKFDIIEDLLESYKTEKEILDLLNGPRRTICDGYSAILKTLIDIAGIPSVRCSGPVGEYNGYERLFNDSLDVIMTDKKYEETPDLNHAWNMAYVDNRWIIIDSTWDSHNAYENGNRSAQQPATHEWFDISLEEFSRNHLCEYFSKIEPWNSIPIFQEATIPNGIRILPERMFYGVQNLVSVVIPDSVTSIGKYSFQHSKYLTIYGSVGSAAEKYANDNGISFSTGLPTSIALNISTASEWSKADIGEAAKKGFLEISLQKDYSDVITRQDFCRIALSYIAYRDDRIFGGLYLTENGYKMPSSSSDVKFSDTETIDGVSFIPEYAYYLGITNGVKAPTATEPGIFDQLGTMTREQAATMIMNTCKAMGMDVNTSSTTTFNDQNEISPWATQGINFVVANGIMSGVGDNKFNPKGTYTRQEAIVTFNRIK